MTRAAAIDIGTNTVRLLVADLYGVTVDHVLRDLEITRLGKGVDASGHLDPDARARTLDAVGRFADRARETGAEVLRVAGTSVLRDAADREGFAREVWGATGAELEILDGTDEGRLAFVGATHDVSGGPFLVVDIGGGSTELVRGDREPEAVRSVDVGSVRIRERCLLSDPPSTEEIADAARVIDEALTDADGVVEGDETTIAVAGTATTLAALHLGLDRYDPDAVHGTQIPARAVDDWKQILLLESAGEIRRRWPIVQQGREDVIGAGVLVLTRVLERWGLASVRISERDILDGLVLGAADFG